MTMPTDADLVAAFQPHPTTLSAAFWDGAREDRLLITRCADCRRWQHPPLASCPACRGPLVAENAPLTGVIYSCTTMRYPTVPLFEPPYVVAVVELGGRGGPRVVMRVVGPGASHASPDDVVRVDFQSLPGGSFNTPVAVVETASEEAL